MSEKGKLNFAKIHEWERKFARERDWEQFHLPKNLAMALGAEVGELLEIFQWLSEKEASDIMSQPQKSRALRHELADIFYYLTRLADVLGVDLEKAFWEKMELNKKKYPADLVRGSAKKYTEWESQRKDF